LQARASDDNLKKLGTIMSAARSGNAATGAGIDPALLNFWENDTLDERESRLRTTVPPMPEITESLQVVTGKAETLAYLILQTVKSDDKRVIVRALASAIAILFNDSSTNFTGSTKAPERLTGLDRVIDDNATDDVILTTNFEDESPVTVGEIRELLDCDNDELGAYFGVLCLAGVKALTNENKSAFNERRAKAVRAVTIDELKIFVADSKYLTDRTLRAIYASFNSLQAIRCHIMQRTATRMGAVHMGPTAAFATMFLLLQDQGMSALRIIKEAVKKFPWIREGFPEFHPELMAAQNGIRAIAQVETPGLRPFLKAIWGSNFVPVQYAAINNLLGLCRHVLIETTPSYANYRGGARISNEHEQRVMRYLGRTATVVETATQE
jgi:hypothetical protein